MAAPNLPQPIYANQGGGGDFLSQLLLTVASQAPGVIMQQLARKDENQRLEAKGQAALPAIQQMGLAAQADPSLGALAASVGAFGQLDPKTQLRSGADFLAQSQELLMTLQQQAALRAQTESAQAATAATRGAEQRAGEMHAGALTRQATDNRRAEVESIHFQNMMPLEEEIAKAQAAALRAAESRDYASAAAENMRASGAEAQIALERDRFAMELEAFEREAFTATVETLVTQGNNPAAARSMASMLHYGTPKVPSVAELRADAQARAQGGQTNMFQQMRDRLISRVNEAGYPMTPGTADQLDQQLLNANGNAQAAMDAIVASGQLMPDELPVVALYLSGAAGTPVKINGVKPTLSDRLRRFMQTMITVSGRGPGSPRGSKPALTPQALQQQLNISGGSGTTNYMQLDSAGLDAQMRRSAAGVMNRDFRPPR